MGMLALPRPGGMTALAIVAFVFAGLELLAAMSLVSAFVMLQSGFDIDAAEARADAFQEGEDIEGPVIDKQGLQVFRSIQRHPKAYYLNLFLHILAIPALVVGGIGILKMRRGIGRNLGGLAAFIVLGASAQSVIMQGMTMKALADMVFPALMLVYLFVVFRKDFVSKATMQRLALASHLSPPPIGIPHYPVNVPVPPASPLPGTPPPHTGSEAPPSPSSAE